MSVYSPSQDDGSKQETDLRIDAEHPAQCVSPREEVHINKGKTKGGRGNRKKLNLNSKRKFGFLGQGMGKRFRYFLWVRRR